MISIYHSFVVEDRQGLTNRCHFFLRSQRSPHLGMMAIDVVTLGQDAIFINRDSKIGDVDGDALFQINPPLALAVEAGQALGRPVLARRPRRISCSPNCSGRWTRTQPWLKARFSWANRWREGVSCR